MILSFAKRPFKYALYYFKESLLFIIFSPLILGCLIILLFTGVTNWLWHNPHPSESPEDYKKRLYYNHSDW